MPEALRLQEDFSTDEFRDLARRSKNVSQSRQLLALAAVRDGKDRTARRTMFARWRRVDRQRVIKKRFGVDFHKRYVETLLKKLGFARISVRPRHPAQDERTIEEYKKTSQRR